MAFLKHPKEKGPGFRQRLQTQTVKHAQSCAERETVMTWAGDGRLIIEQHRGITEYGEKQISLLGKSCRIRICGEGMYLAFLDGRDLCVQGKILSVELLDHCGGVT